MHRVGRLGGGGFLLKARCLVHQTKNSKWVESRVLKGTHFISVICRAETFPVSFPAGGLEMDYFLARGSVGRKLSKKVQIN